MPDDAQANEQQGREIPLGEETKGQRDQCSQGKGGKVADQIERMMAFAGLLREIIDFLERECAALSTKSGGREA